MKLLKCNPPACASFLFLFFLTLSGPLLAAEPLIAVTMPPLAGVVKLLDPTANILCLLPGNSDPHHAELGPRQIEKLSKAKLLIRSSRDDGSWRGLNKPGVKIFDFTSSSSADHFWLVPSEVKKMLPRLRDQLIALQPAKISMINSALPKALALCDAMDREWQVVLAPLRDHGVIMQHGAWKVLCEQNRVPVLVVLESAQHGHEMGEIGPRILEIAIAAARSHPGVLFFGDASERNQALERVAAAVKQPVIPLNSIGSAAISWSALMRQNLALIHHQ